MANTNICRTLWLGKVFSYALFWVRAENIVYAEFSACLKFILKELRPLSSQIIWLITHSKIRNSVPGCNSIPDHFHFICRKIEGGKLHSAVSKPISQADITRKSFSPKMNAIRLRRFVFTLFQRRCWHQKYAPQISLAISLIDAQCQFYFITNNHQSRTLIRNISLTFLTCLE